MGATLSPPLAPAAAAECENRIQEELNRMHVRSEQVTSMQVVHSRGGGLATKNYRINAWVRLETCRGYAVVTLTPGNILKKVMAKANISIGPNTQFWNKESPRTLVFLNTSPNSSYFTLAKGGYIIIIRPIAIGILVVPEEMLFQNSATLGLSQPANTPANMARKIHSVKYLSKNFKCFVVLIIYS
jgi:hypothetical protein